MNSVKVFNTHRKHRVRSAETIRLVRRVLKGERCSDAELNIVFIDDNRMLDLNTSYLRHRYPTDVISFSFADNGKKKIEGEVYINIDQAKRQSEEYSVSMSNELQRLVAHGVLHLLGYDDATKRQRAAMTKREDFYLQEMN